MKRDDLAARTRVALGLQPGDALREALQEAARSVAERFDELWAQSAALEDGVIDVIDFFSGCGGMSAGFRAANSIAPAYRNVLAVDINPAANETYRANLGLEPTLADVSELAADPEKLERLVGGSARNSENPLVVIGCAPCQGFSSHRNAAGSTDTRNDLFVDFARIAVRLEPDFIVVENVPEICTDRYWPHVERARRIFSEAGYSTHLAVHNMAQFGLPQERFRAVMLASKKPFLPPAGYRSADSYRTVRDAIGRLPPVAAGEANSTDPMHRSAAHRESTIEMIRSVPKNGGSRGMSSGPAGLAALGERQGKPAYEDVYGRLHWDRPAITITHYSRNPASGRFVHPDQDRGLTLREAALLQGFPARYSFVGGFDDMFSQVGNAVPPVVAAHLATWILGQILDPPSDHVEPGVQAPLAKSFSRLIPGLKAQARRAASTTGVPA